MPGSPSRIRHKKRHYRGQKTYHPTQVVTDPHQRKQMRAKQPKSKMFNSIRELFADLGRRWEIGCRSLPLAQS